MQSEIELPDDLAITRVESAVVLGTRPRVVGCNARLGTHGQCARDHIVWLQTNAGIVGWGWSRAKPEDARRLVGQRLDQVFSLPGGTADAFLAFDLPLWDLAGRALGQPVYALLGGEGCSAVPVYDGSIYMEDVDPETGEDRGLQPVLEAVRMGLDAGYRAFKVKIGRGCRWMERQAGLRRDAEVLHAVRALVGDEITLLVDANDGYTFTEACAFVQQAGDCDLYWFEEPFPEDPLETMALKRHIQEEGWRTLVADGEGGEDGDATVTEVVRAGGIDVVQLDMRYYGLTRWLRYLPVIAATGSLAAPHNWGSHLGGYYIAHFARGCARFAMAETDPMVMPAVIAEGYELVDGRLQVPSAPGFGLELDPAFLVEAGLGERSWLVQ